MANEKNVLGTAESTEVFNDYEFSPVPDEKKNTWKSQIFVWLGVGFCLTAFTLGGQIALGLGFWPTVAAVFIGGIILFVLLKIIIAVVIRAADVVNKLPVIGTANKIVGAVIGCIYGVVLALAVSLIIGVMPSSESTGFNDMRQGSFFVNIFMDKNNDSELYDAQYAAEYGTDNYIEGE